MSVSFAPMTSVARRILNDRTSLRQLLMVAIPALALVVIAYFYFTSGRYVSTDNAYVKADMVSVSPDVGGRIVKVFVKQNEVVTAGTALFQIDPEPYIIALAEANAQLQAAKSNVESLNAKYQMTVAQLGLAKSNIDYYSREFLRQASLAKSSYASQCKLDTARHNLD